MTEPHGAALPTTPTRATLRAVLSATTTRWTLGCLTSAIPMNRPGVWFGRRLIATIMAAFGSMPGGTRIVPVTGPGLRGRPADAHDRGRLYVVPQFHATAIWHLKRHFPALYARGADLLGRVLPKN